MDERFPNKLYNKYTGILIIAGCGRCVWEDLEKAGVARNEDHDILCVNSMVEHYPGRVEHVYSNDHRLLPHWVGARRPKFIRNWEQVKHIHSNNTAPRGGGNVWPWPGHGSSGLNAVYTGLALGYDQIWLCGIPLDDEGHYFDAPWIKTNFTHEVGSRENGDIKYWSNAARRIFDGKVKSFSGRTKELLGEPK